jgi:hypothetical protein
MLPLVRGAAERRWHVEGDDVVPDAHAQLTHAIVIDAPPKDVWPWLTMALALPAIAVVHRVMERKQLRTIKHHAEHMHA